MSHLTSKIIMWIVLLALTVVLIASTTKPNSDIVFTVAIIGIGIMAGLLRLIEQKK